MKPAKRKAKRKLDPEKIELSQQEDALLTIIAKIVTEIIIREMEEEETAEQSKKLT